MAVSADKLSGNQRFHPAVVMIGLDAASPAFIEQHRSVLPNLTRFLGGGLHPLRVEPLSGAVWPTFLTGRTPDHHGFFHHMQWSPSEMRMRRSHPSWIGPIEPFWRDLAKRGARVVAFDVPFVFKGDEKGAIEISNWGSHDLVGGFWCSDPAVRRIVTDVAPRHPMGLEVPVTKTRAKLLEAQRDIVRGIDLKTEISRRLIDRLSPDLCIVVFGELHRAGHLLWPERHTNSSEVPDAALLKVYQAIDKAVGTLADDIAPDSDIVLFSLHGMGPNQSQSHLSRAMLQIALSGSAAVPEDKGGLVRLLRSKVPHSVQHRIATHVPGAVRDFVFAREIGGGVDWSRTKAFSLEGDLFGYWRLNVRGREARGVVEDAEAEANRIAAVFREFTTTDGNAICQGVQFPSREGKGERSFLLPDVLVEWNPSLTALDAAVHPSGAVASGVHATGRSGNHRFEGFVGLRGNDLPSSALPLHISGLGRFATQLLLRRQTESV